MSNSGRKSNMLVMVGVVLLVLWLLGLMTSYTAGGAIHVLLLIALILFAVRYI